MSQLVRWQYAVPRLLLVVVSLMAVHYGLCLVTRSHVIHSAEAIVGGSSELSTIHASFAKGRVVLGDFRVGDPRQKLGNLFTARRCDLVFDVDAFLRRGKLVGHGEITGLRLLTPGAERRVTSDRAAQPSSPPILFGEQEAQATRDLLAMWSARLERDWTPQLPSVQRLNELRDQLAKQDRILTTRLAKLQQQSADLQALAMAAEANPLRNGDFLVRLPDDVKAMQGQRASLAADVENVTDQLETGRRAIVAARILDQEYLREQLQIEAAAAGPLTAYLFGEQVREVLTEIVGWLQATRQVFPAEATDRNTAAAELRQSPGLLLQNLTLQGTMQIGDQPVEVRGTLTDFTTEPRLSDRPMRLRLASDSSPAIDVSLTIDRSRPTARDELLVECRQLALPAAVLGESGGVQLRVAPSKGALNISLRAEGDELTGDIQLVQSEVRIAACFGEQLGDEAAAGELQTALEGVGSVATRITVRGNAAKPQATIWSSLAPATAEAMRLAMRRSAAVRASQVASEAQCRIDEQLAVLDRQTTEKQAELLARSAAPDDWLERLAARYAPAKRLDVERLGRRLPMNSLFR
jgi:uncharacterized protein (TIGR03545 family)